LVLRGKEDVNVLSLNRVDRAQRLTYSRAFIVFTRMSKSANNLLPEEI
jgi:hypothetical protein